MLKVFANLFWIKASAQLQKRVSLVFSFLWTTKFSRFVILPYCWLFSLDSDYLEQFEPEVKRNRYGSYSEFFERKYKKFPQIKSSQIWPCEGYVCDWGAFKVKTDSVVKGQRLDLNSIFQSNPKDTQEHYFVNVFLHNHNYHRIHSPISGIISQIKTIPGNLLFLRPWFYEKNDVSFPAFKNERVVIEIKNQSAQTWYLAMVGGFGVGTIEINSKTIVGCNVEIGQEIAKFKLGSTVCMASPQVVSIDTYLQKVQVGEIIKIQT